MKTLKESVLSSFDDKDLDRADKYIDNVRESLKHTNSKFGAYTLLLILSLLAYHLTLIGNLNEISILGITVKDIRFIKIWFLIVPSTIWVLTASIGYLRVYQQECIEWLLAKYRAKEFSSGIFRLTFPSSHILGLDVLRRQNNWISKLIGYVTTIPLAYGSVIAPFCYIIWAYDTSLHEIGSDTMLIISCSISGILLFCGAVVISLSQKI